MSEQSLGRVVHNIMESLSDAISGLILLVITLQEQNAAVPPNIIAGSESVCTTANNLAEIASEVALSEYEDYPELQRPILDAAKDVRTSGVSLQQAVQNLSKSSDRAGAWTRHLEACRTISGQTVLILQLVYGAELKRLMMVSEALKDLAGNTSAELVSTPQKLADRASELATMASDLASFYAERAKDDPACRIAAEKLEQLSDEIPELANRLLADPKNEKLKKEFNDKIKELQKEIENAMAPVKDLIKMQPDVVMPKADVPKVAKAPLKMETAPKAVNEGTHGAKVHPTSDPVKTAERAKEIIVALTEAAQSKNVPSAVREATNLNNTVAPLLACLETLNQGSKDPERQKQLKSIADDVKAVLPVVIQAVEKELKEPTVSPKGTSPAAKAAEEAKTVLSAVAQIAAPAPEVEKAAGTPNVLADIRKQIDEIALLDSAAALGEPKAIAARQKAIARREPQIDRALLAIADDPFLNNPKAKTNLVKAVSKIDEILPAEIKAAEEVVKKPKDQEPKAKLGKSTKEHKLTLAEVAADLAGEGDLPTTSSPGNLMDKMKELVDALQSGKDDPDNDILANLLSAIGPALEQMLDEAAPDEEQVAANEIAKAADEIVKMLDQMQETAEKNPAGIDALGEKIKRKTKELGALAAPYAEKYLDPEQKKLFDAAMDDLSALLPEIIKAAHACGKNPKPKEKERLKNLVAAAQKNAKYVRQVKPPVDPGPGPRLIRIKKGIRKLVDDGDGAPIEDFRKVLENLKKIIREAIPPKAAKEKGPAYEGPKKILEALSALEKKIEERQKKNPQDKSPAWKAFPEAKEFFEKLAKDPNPIAKPTPKEKLEQQVPEALTLLDRLVGAAPNAAKDPSKVVDVTKPLVQKLKDIIENIKTNAPKDPDPVVQKLVDEIPRLEQEIAPLVNIAKELVQNPDDETAIQNLNDIVARLREPLIDVQKAIRPTDPILAAKAAAAKEQNALQKLRRAAAAKDPQALKNAMTNAQDAHNKFVKAAKSAAEKAPDAAKKDLSKDIEAVDLKFKAIAPLVSGLAQAPTDANKEKLLDAIRDAEIPLGKAAENLERIPEAQNDQAVELAKTIRAAIKERSNRKKFDPSHLLKVSKELAGLLNDMVSHTRVEAQKGGESSERAKAALQLDSMLLSLDKSATAAPGSGPVQSVDAALSSLSSLTLNMPGGSSSAQPTALSKNIMQVVGDMKKKTSSSASLEGTAVHALTQGLASDLAKFADADSGSKRSELIVLGRSVAANIVKLAEELTRLAGLCTDPKMKEKLLQNALILRNTATQLKIIASVRAASSQNNDTTTDQLSILTQNLGVIIAEATNTITIVKQTKRGL